MRASANTSHEPQLAEAAVQAAAVVAILVRA